MCVGSRTEEGSEEKIGKYPALTKGSPKPIPPPCALSLFPINVHSNCLTTHNNTGFLTYIGT